MSRRLKNFLPQPETPVLLVIDRGQSYERSMELIYVDCVRVEGLSPDLVKFRDPEDNSFVIIQYRAISEWRYN